MLLEFYALLLLSALLMFALLRTLWNQHKIKTRLSKCNLPVRPITNLHQLIKVWWRRNDNYYHQNWFFRYLHARARMYDNERINASCVAGKVTVYLYKPDYIEKILNSYAVLDKCESYKVLRPWLGNGIATCDRGSWKPRRKLITPLFHVKTLENFHNVINKHSFTLIKKLKEKIKEPWINIVDTMSLCLLDISSETSMGIEINAQEDEGSEYVKAMKRNEELFSKRSFTASIYNAFPWLLENRFFKRYTKATEFENVVNFLNSITEKLISKKKQDIKEKTSRTINDNISTQSKNRKSILDLLLHHHLNGGDITEEDIRYEVNTFISASLETVSLNICWTLYNLGIYLDIQQKVYNEIRSIFGDDKETPVTSDDIKDMKYTECVFKESLRLFPSFPFIGRDAKEDFKLNEKITIPAKSNVVIQIYSLHRDPEYYPNPEIFDPTRFLPENSVARHPFAFIPFSAGPRNCVGQKLAMMEGKIIMANILRHFTVLSLDHHDKVPLRGEIGIRPTNELRLQFKER